MNAWLPQASYPCDVPPQPNSPPDNVLRSIDQAKSWSKRRVVTPPDSRIGFPCPHSVLSWLFDARESSRRAAPSPPLGRHEAVRSRHVSGSSSPPTVDGFGTGTPEPSPQSQSFSRSYGSILPTSLAYIVPSTRGCSPWRPDAVMSTTGRERTRPPDFQGPPECTDTTRRGGALPAAGPYLR
ncbi:hypothetical protein Bca52824_094571 [Brassica carinata]|uniref:Uncharacterized protein n=1 Tax=Brassica carinata TaxID=52824 RepID=A0A8X7TJP5_BRACI|nr:hypothetical protein Bca52824_094571 [Brassica carinata]